MPLRRRRLIAARRQAFVFPVLAAFLPGLSALTMVVVALQLVVAGELLAGVELDLAWAAFLKVGPVVR